MKISLKNLGLLDEADFNVGDFTIICGENNTGKTYATYAFYGFWKDIGSIITYVALKFEESFDFNNKILSIDNDAFKDILNKLPDEINKTYQSKLHQILAGKEDDFKNSIFKIDIELRALAENFQSEYLSIEIKETENKIYFKFNANDYPNKHNYITLLILVFFKNFINVNIISVERTGASMFNKELNLNKNNMINAIAQASEKNMYKDINKILKQSSSRYPLPVTDNIDTIQDLEVISKNKSFILENEQKYQNIIELLWQIVGGKYIIDDIGIKFANGAKKKIMENNKVIALQQASSSIKSLLLLNFYILNSAKVGDILIIDEPELNLHPKNQILIARLLVMLVNAGIKVFITTHSDYIVREISNCIALQNLDESDFGGIYNKDCKLEANKVKAYVAKNHKGKNILESIKITQEEGIFMDTFNDAIEEQNENQIKIYEKVLKAKNADKQ